MKINLMKKFVALGVLLLHILSACSKDKNPDIVPRNFESPFFLVKAPGALLLKSLELYNNNDATVIKQVQNLISDAENSLNNPPQSVINKTFMPPSGDKHDYYSMGPYWWPNPDTDDGLPYIRKDGKVNSESRDGTFDYKRFDQTCSDIYTLAMSYWFTKNERYREKALEFIKVWFISESTRMNPNLNYGQAIPGITDGRPAGIIETTKLFNIIDAYFLLEYHEPISEDLTQELKSWFHDYRNWLLTNNKGVKERQSSNNHGTWYDAQILAFDIFSDDNDEVEQYIKSYSLTRLESHIASDGSQPHEISRTKSLNYSLMNMRGHIMAANLAGFHGIDIFNYKDHIIKLGIEYISKNLPPNGEWPHTQILTISPTHYNDLAQIIINYNYNPLTEEKIEGANNLSVDLNNWDWLIFGGKP